MNEWVTLDLPEESVERWEQYIGLPAGQTLLLGISPEGGKAGGSAALVVEAREPGEP